MSVGVNLDSLFKGGRACSRYDLTDTAVIVIKNKPSTDKNDGDRQNSQTSKKYE